MTITSKTNNLGSRSPRYPDTTLGFDFTPFPLAANSRSVADLPIEKGS